MSTAGASPKILALDASTVTGRLVLWRGEDYLDAKLGGALHGEQLLDSITDLLRQAELELGDLDALAIVNGPGSLTGIRLACAVGQALAWAHNLPVTPLNSLVALAWDRLANTDGAILLDARMGYCYVTRFCRGSWQAAETASRHLPLDILPQYLRHYADGQYPVLYHGREDTLARLNSKQNGLGQLQLVITNPTAANLAEYAREKWRTGGCIPATALEPSYLAEWAARS